MGQAPTIQSRRSLARSAAVAALLLGLAAGWAQAIPPVRKSPGGDFVTDLGGGRYSIPRGQVIEWTVTLCNDTPDAFTARVFDFLHAGDCGPDHVYLNLVCPATIEPPSAGGRVAACGDLLVTPLDVVDMNVAAAGCVEVRFGTRVDLLTPDTVPELCNIAFYETDSAGAGQTSAPGAAGPGCSCVELEPPLPTELNLSLSVADETPHFAGGAPESSALWTVVGENLSPRPARGRVAMPMPPGLVVSEIVDCPTGAACSVGAMGELLVDDLYVAEAGDFVVRFRTGSDCRAYGVDELCGQAAFAPAESPTAAILSDSDELAPGEQPTCLAIASEDLSGSTKTWELVDDADGDGAVSAGDRIRFHLDIWNRGLAPARDVVVTDGVALGFDRATVTVDPSGSYDGLTATWMLPSLGPGALAELWLEATLTSASACNRARIESREGLACTGMDLTTDDPFTPAMEDSTCPAGTGNPLPMVRKSFSFNDRNLNDQVDDGEAVTLRLEIRNEGLATATGVVLEDLLAACWDDLDPIGVTIEPPAAGLNTSDPRTLRIEEIGGADGLAPLEEVVVTVTVTPLAAAGCCNQATVTWLESAVGLPSDDPRTLDAALDPTCLDFAEAAHPRLFKDVAVIDGDGDGRAGTGDTLHYTLTVRNDGIARTEGLLLSDDLPPGLELDVGSLVDDPPGSLSWRIVPAPDGAFGSGRIEVLDVSVAAGAEATLSFEARLVGDGLTCNRAVLAVPELGRPVPSEDVDTGGPTCVDVIHVPKAELELAIASAGPLVEACALPGEEWHPRVEWTVAGDAPATNAMLVFDHSPNFEVLDPDGATEVLPGRLTWDLGVLPLGDSGFRAPILKAACTLAPGQDLDASARLTADSSLQAAEAAWPGVTTARPEILGSIAQVHDDGDGNGSWSLGESVTITVRLEEIGGCAAENLEVVVGLPTGVEIAAVRDGGMAAGAMITWAPPAASGLELLDPLGFVELGADLVAGPDLLNCSRPSLSALAQWPALPGTDCDTNGSWNQPRVSLPRADCVSPALVTLLREDAVSSLRPGGPTPPLADLLDAMGEWNGCDGPEPRIARDRVLLDDAEIPLETGVPASGDGRPVGEGNPGVLIFYEAADSCAPLRVCKIDEDGDPLTGRETVLLTTGAACDP